MEKNIISDTHHRITHMYVTFQQNLVSRLIKNRARKFICKKIASCKSLPLPIVILQKIDYSDMHNRKTYMYMHISFKPNWVSRSFKTVHTNVFAINRKLHKFATCN